MKLLTFVIDFLFLSRPVLLIPVWGFSALGFWRARLLYEPFSLRAAWRWSGWAAFIWIVVFSFSVASVYILNQIADREVDTLNGGRPLLSFGAVGKKGAWVSAAFFAFMSLAPAARYAPEIAPFCVASLLLGALYSFRPTYFSGRPFLDFTANAVGYGIIAFGAGWTLGGGPWGFSFLRAACPYFFLMCAGSISSTLPDAKGDRSCGKNTTTVALGEHTAHILAMLFLCLAAVAGFLARDYCALAAAGLTFPIYALYVLNPSRMWMEASYKVGGAIVMTIAGVVFPFLLAPAAAVVGAVRLYFYLRHNARYPALIPDS